jgi:hypothetical protein
MEKVRPNFYRITPLGLAEASSLEQLPSAAPSPRANQAIYDAVERYVFHPVFRRYLDEPEEPRTWLGLQSFLGLSRNSYIDLEDALRRVREAAKKVLAAMEEAKADVMRSGAVGGRKSIMKVEIEKLLGFADALEERFEMEIDALRKQDRRRVTR